MSVKKKSFSTKFGKLFNLPVSLIVSTLILASFSLASGIWLVSNSGNTNVYKSVLGDSDEHEEVEHKSDENEKHEDEQENEKHEDENESKDEGSEHKEEQEKEKHEDEDKNETEDSLAVEQEDQGEGEHKEESKDLNDDKENHNYNKEEDKHVSSENDDNSNYKYEYYDGELKVKVNSENDQTEIETEGNGQKFVLKVKDSEVEIAADEKGLVFAHNGIEAVSSQPLSVDPETDELVATTSDGSKVVSMLPDDVFDKLVEESIIDDGDDNGDVTLDTNDKNELVYHAKFSKKRKLLGLIPVTTETNAELSADSGEVLSVDISLFNRLLGLLSL